MANLDQIKKLNQHYGKTSPFINYNVRGNISEGFDQDRIEKAIQSSISGLGPDYALHFDLGFDTDVALLFIDICNFSTRFGHLSGEKIGEYFDKYYDIVIPIIYEYGGEIDKIIGDGIICVFGPPFQKGDLKFNIEKANDCAKKIIISTLDTDFSSKVAFHCGRINYFRNKTGLYNEFTIIGKPMTELFRLETISIENRINYFDATEIRSFYKSRFSNNPDSSLSKLVPWSHVSRKIKDLKGVDFDQFFSIIYNK